MKSGASIVFALLASAGTSLAQESLVPALRERAKEGTASSSLALGHALRVAGHPEGAAKELARGATLPLGSIGEVGLRLRYEGAKCLIDQHKFAQAIVACKAFDKAPGGHPLASACAGEAHMMRKRATDAVPELQAALRDAPSLYEAKVAYAEAEAQQGAFDSAETQLKEAIFAEPRRSEAIVRLALIEEALGKREEALGDARRAHQIDPHDPDASFHVGRLLPAGDEAARATQAAIDDRPQFARAFARLAEIELERGRVAPAEAAARQALAQDPHVAEGHVVLGRVLLAGRRPDEALVESRAALEIVSNLGAAKLVEADAYAQKGEIDLATESYQLASGYAKDDPAPLVHAASASLLAGRETSAQAFAERSVDQFPRFAPAWIALGDVRARSKDAQGARKAYEKALALGSENPEARKKLEALR